MREGKENRLSRGPSGMAPFWPPPARAQARAQARRLELRARRPPGPRRCEHGALAASARRRRHSKRSTTRPWRPGRPRSSSTASTAATSRCTPRSRRTSRRSRLPACPSSARPWTPSSPPRSAAASTSATSLTRVPPTCSSGRRLAHQVHAGHRLEPGGPCARLGRPERHVLRRDDLRLRDRHQQQLVGSRPPDWSDLENPVYKGKIAMLDPTAIGLVADNFAHLVSSRLTRLEAGPQGQRRADLPGDQHHRAAHRGRPGAKGVRPP